MSPRLTAGLATTHEAVYPRLDTLLRQVESVGARRPEAPVPAETRAAAEALLFECQRFGRSPAGAARGLPPAPDTYGALATVLGQALAGLVAYETAHSSWSAAHNGFVWRLPAGDLRPVARLRPQLAAPPVARTDRVAARRRAELLRHIAARYEEGFDDGRRAAASAPSIGAPPAGEDRRPSLAPPGEGPV